LFKEALLAGVKYTEGRVVVEFEVTYSMSEKLIYIYRLFVPDKVIQPLPEEWVAEKALRHKLFFLDLAYLQEKGSIFSINNNFLVFFPVYWNVFPITTLNKIRY
jgi:hypothetical protein